MADNDSIYVRFRGRTLGPLTSQKVRELIQRGQITRMHELSGNGLSWAKAEDFGDFFARPQANPAVAESNETTAQAEPTSTVNPNAAVEPTVEWYAHIDDQNQGPITFAQLNQWITSGTVDAKTLVWRSGLDSWQPAGRAVPELFGTQHLLSEPAAVASGQQGIDAPSRAGGSSDFTTLAREFNRQRAWTFFFAILLVILASFGILADFVIILTAATGSAAGANTVLPMLAGILGIAFAGTVMTAGILLLQYCGRVSKLLVASSEHSMLLAAKSLNAFWIFVGITSLIWLVTLTTILIVLFSMGLVAINQFA